jgi:exosortase
MPQRTTLLAGCAALAAAAVWVYAPVTADLVRAWITDDNYSHGFLVPPLAAYFAWERRHRLRAAAVAPSMWGLVALTLSLLILIVGRLGAEFFLTRASLVGVLGSLVLWLGGVAHLRILFFPLTFLLLMIPIPAILFNQIAFPLQLLASQTGEVGLMAMSIPVLREGNLIVLPRTTLEVAEACSGIRSLISLMTLGIVYGYFTDSRSSVRLLIAASTVPIAVVANGMRIIGTGVAAHQFGAAAAEGFFHTFSGWIVFFVAFGCVTLLQQMVARVSPPRPVPALA